jgi:hypothetical protein
MIESTTDAWKCQLIDLKYTRALAAKTQAQAIEVLNAFVRDESVPLFDRWCAFMEYSDMYPVASFASGVPKCIVNHIREIQDLDRYQVVIFADIFEEDWYPEENENWDEESKKDCKSDFDKIPADFVRSLITCGHSGFTNDW